MGAWVPTSLSQRGWCLGLTLPETQNGRYLSTSGALGHAEAPIHFLGSWVRQIGGEIPSAHVSS
jgi:hypothetical protein